MRPLKLVLPAVFLLVIGGVFARGLLHRGDYPVTPGMGKDPAAAFTDGRPNLVAATFYSAWCSGCAVLDPKLRGIAPEFENRAVEFVKFDFSMGQPEALAEKARALGVEDIYLANKGATGFMALIDRRTQSVLGTITMSQSEQSIRDAIEAAIAAAGAPAA